VEITTIHLVAIARNQSSKFHVLSVRVPWGTTERAEMQDAERYTQYATECERIARTMSEGQRNSLLSIAKAWRELAREAERKSGEKDKP
jgi:hypothetical protein